MSRLDEALLKALEACDKAERDCPVNRGKVAFRAPCPKCNATAGETCWPSARADADFVREARKLVARTTPAPEQKIAERRGER